MTEKISNIEAFQILDSRGNPTVQVRLTTSGGVIGESRVPSGASTGTHEALELRDGDATHFQGLGVMKALRNITEEILPALKGRAVQEQQMIDELMMTLDGTPNKSRLGANAILAVSMAVLRAAAAAEKTELYRYLNPRATQFTMPLPLFNVINGGKHADNGLTIQEFKLVPVGAKTFAEAMEFGAEVFQTLKKTLHQRGDITAVGDEGGFAPRISSDEEAIQLLVQAIEDAGYRPGVDIALGLDVAASEFFHSGSYVFGLERKNYSAQELISLYENWCTKYPIVSIEDGLAEDDFESWQVLQQRLGKKCQIMGDDLIVTNPARLTQTIEMAACNAVLIKPNQIGTISEVFEVVRIAKKADFGTVISHRSGETEDTIIADLAVGLDLRQIKSGSLSRSERLAKYNRLLLIESDLKEAAVFQPPLTGPHGVL